MASCYSHCHFGISVTIDDLSSGLHKVNEEIHHTALDELQVDERAALVQLIRYLAARLNILAELAWSMRTGKPISLPPSASNSHAGSDLLYLQLPSAYPSTASLYRALRQAATMQEQFSRIRCGKLSYADIDWLEELELRTRTLAFEFLTELVPKVEQVPTKSRLGLVSPMSRTWSDSTTSSILDLKQSVGDWSSNDSSPSSSWSSRGW